MSIVKFIFSSLFKNDPIIEESKKKPWWLAIVFFVVSCVIALVPNIVNTSKINGSDVITASENYNLDYSLKTFSYEYLTKDESGNSKIKMFINESGILNFTDSTTNAAYTDPIYIKYGEITTLSIQYVPDANNISTIIDHLKAAHPLEEGKSSIKSMLLFGQENVWLYLYDNTATCTYTLDNNHPIIATSSDPISTLQGSYQKVKEAHKNFNSYFDTSVDKSDAYEKALSQWCSFFDESYKTTKTSVIWTSVLVFGGLDVIIIAIMSLTIFLLSRSKTSIRKYSYLGALKMTFFASLSPAILAMLLGFMISSMQAVSFVLMLGLRITWLGMKATSPNQSGGQAVRK